MSCPRQLLQQAWRPARACRSYASSSKTPSLEETYNLPPQKLRALISLYHQTSSFITRETLSADIDKAFIKDAVQLVPKPQLTVSDMKLVAAQFEKQPKLSEWDSLWEPAAKTTTSQGTFTGLSEPNTASGSSWSDQSSLREGKVMEALFGTDMSDTGNAKPGLEAIEDLIRSGDMQDMLEDWEKKKAAKKAAEKGVCLCARSSTTC